MRGVFLAVVACALLDTPAFAQNDVMVSRYGNTIVTIDANGNRSMIHYRADGSFDGTQGALKFSGTWKLDGSGNVCLSATTSIPNLPYPVCSPAIPRKIGDTWRAGAFTLTLVEGIR